MVKLPDDLPVEVFSGKGPSQRACDAFPAFPAFQAGGDAPVEAVDGIDGIDEIRRFHSSAEYCS